MPQIRLLGDSQYMDVLNGCPGTIVGSAITAADDMFILDKLPQNELLMLSANGLPGGGWLLLHFVPSTVDPVDEPADESNSVIVTYGERFYFKTTPSYPKLNVTVVNAGGGFAVYLMR